MLRATWSIKIDQICSIKLRRFHILIVPTDTETRTWCWQHGLIFRFNRRTLWYALRWRHNGHDSVSNHQPHRCLLNRLFRRRSKKTSKLRVTGICVGNSPGTGEFPAQMASNAENVSIWWRHHGYSKIATVTELKHSKFQELYPRFTVSRGFGADAVRSVQVTFTHIFHSDINGA